MRKAVGEIEPVQEHRALEPGGLAGVERLRDDRLGFVVGLGTCAFVVLREEPHDPLRDALSAAGHLLQLVFVLVEEPVCDLAAVPREGRASRARAGQGHLAPELLGMAHAVVEEVQVRRPFEERSAGRRRAGLCAAHVVRVLAWRGLDQRPGDVRLAGRCVRGQKLGRRAGSDNSRRGNPRVAASREVDLRLAGPEHRSRACLGEGVVGREARRARRDRRQARPTLRARCVRRSSMPAAPASMTVPPGRRRMPSIGAVSPRNHEAAAKTRQARARLARPSRGRSQALRGDSTRPRLRRPRPRRRARRRARR